MIVINANGVVKTSKKKPSTPFYDQTPTRLPVRRIKVKASKKVTCQRHLRGPDTTWPLGVLEQK
jgi:hypothetical protein